ncbi:mucoidy inhibitor MuiA family protein [Planctomycetaceae bacterium SH139]
MPRCLFASLLVATFCAVDFFCAADLSFAQSNSFPAVRQDEQTAASVAGAIRRVTVYRDRALVSREISVAADAPSDMLTISGLPEQLIPGSVYAEGDGQTEVRAVEVAVRSTANSSRQEVRTVEQELSDLQDEKLILDSQLELLQTNAASMEEIVSFTASKTSDDLNRGLLDANAVIELSKYLLTSRQTLLAEQLEIGKQLRDTETAISEKQRQLAELVASDYRQVIEAKIFIDRQPGVAGTITLNYLVDSCQWTPRYAIRGEVGSDKFSLRYSALVQQISGEDWKNVELTLSTASPSVSATGPQLTPFRISATAANQNQFAQQEFGNLSANSKQLTDQVKSIRARQRNVESSLLKESVKNQPLERDLQLNQLAGEIQQLELAAEPNAVTRIAADVDDDVASQVYVLSQPVSLNSRRQQQLVRIAEMELAGELYHVATPLLSSYAYRQAEMINTEPIGLLGGSADVYLNQRFVGVTDLPTTASGQRLLVGFGADQQVRTRRELRTKDDKIRGGNRNLEFTYRLVIANFKDQNVAIRLYDRMPIASESRDVAVNLLPPERPLSEDALYTRISKDRGILRWDLDIPAGSHGSEAFDVEYTYQLEFDRSRSLSMRELNDDRQVDFFMEQQGLPGGMGGGMGGMGGGDAGAGGNPN